MVKNVWKKYKIVKLTIKHFRLIHYLLVLNVKVVFIYKVILNVKKEIQIDVKYTSLTVIHAKNVKKDICQKMINVLNVLIKYKIVKNNLNYLNKYVQSVIMDIKKCNLTQDVGRAKQIIVKYIVQKMYVKSVMKIMNLLILQHVILYKIK